MHGLLSKMSRIQLVLVIVAVLGLAACGSRVETRRKIQATEGKTDTSGSEDQTGYRSWEGSPGQSAEDADAQLGGY